MRRGLPNEPDDIEKGVIVALNSASATVRIQGGQEVFAGLGRVRNLRQHSRVWVERKAGQRNWTIIAKR